jgi:LacI family transcriptional regulator
MANIYQVAKLAGVSSATVSRIINNKSRVTDRTRRKVLAAMKELDYRPNPIAQALATRCTNCIGLLVSELSGPFYGAMLSAIEEALRSEGKFVIVTAGHNDEARERQAVQFLADRNCDALILHAEALSDQYLATLASGSVPVVVVNRAVPGLADRCISLDNRCGGYLATRLLLQNGHQSIAYISGPLHWHDAAERLAGHKRALAEAGLNLNERLVYEGDFLESSGSAGLAWLLEQQVPFTALACANDEMAAGAMGVARARGLEVPADLSIVGFDNAPISRYVYPKLATVDYPIAAMSRMAANWVLRNVYGNDTVEVQHVFEPSIIERESTRSIGDPRRRPLTRPMLRQPSPATQGFSK